MRIGVTGASGFIGSHLTGALKKHGKVIALSRGKSLPSLEDLKSFVPGVELFFHLGGVNRGTDEAILTGNVTGTLRLLEAIRKYGEPSARILFASSAQVYRLKNRVEKISETSSLQPESVYGVSKKSAEDLIRISGLPYTILRLANVYGPGCRPEYNSVVATLCQRAKKKLPLKINGQGKQNRDFIYIDDVVRAFVMAGFSGKPLTGKTYNISSGQMTSLVKVVNTIKGFEKSVKVEFKPGVEDKISYCCDASRYKRKYGWKPKTSLLQGIEKSLKYIGKRK
ncbi:MAG TPA: NAD-dependent epimerase/dehydratase family protein [Nitrospinae bacterium]|nr:NAD-dependent epimerase/dehydratase family protein [Nitrospinota bacterium]